MRPCELPPGLSEKRVDNEYESAEEEHEEVEKYKKGKLSQDARIKGYTADITRLNAVMKNAEMNAAELSVTKDDQFRLGKSYMSLFIDIMMLKTSESSSSCWV